MAPLGDVLRVWQGLGYNRRAKLLHECARVVYTKHRGRWPRSFAELVALPGIGPYTAAAVMAFAYDQGVPLIETNVRTVYLRHFFPDKDGVTDQEILALVALHLSHVSSARTWYAALMDYGAHLKRTEGNHNHRAKTYTKQTRFSGSDRQLRGCMLRAVAERRSVTRSVLRTVCDGFTDERIDHQLKKLVTEGLLVRGRGQCFVLP
jgi:A/G-specific adenine glycosylase